MNLGFGELLVILLIVLLLVGARRLPELGRSLGEAMRAFQEGMRGSSHEDRNKKKTDADHPSEKP